MRVEFILPPVNFGQRKQRPVLHGNKRRSNSNVRAFINHKGPGNIGGITFNRNYFEIGNAPDAIYPGAILFYGSGSFDDAVSRLHYKGMVFNQNQPLATIVDASVVLHKSVL